MTHFILNQKEIKTDLPPGMLLLDFIRYHQHLMGTKIGCREGDCGACTILVGEVKEDALIYSSATSCLMPIGNAAGKHIVTIEGINLVELTAVQEAFSAFGATQCGFCTPGFVVSLTGYCLNNEHSHNKAIESINGNICRCTGYKSIERAADQISNLMELKNGVASLQYAVANKIIPSYFLDIKSRLARIISNQAEKIPGKKKLGGGTDLYVQQHEAMPYEEIDFLFDKSEFNGISRNGDWCEVGAAATVTDIFKSPVFNSVFSELPKYIKLISSTQIRNMATVGGNFVNASPIGDLTIWFLALDAEIILTDGNSNRQIPLKTFYKGYKILDKTPEEHIKKIIFKLPGKESRFNFEKISKRAHLDIASVNSAMLISLDGDMIVSAYISAGGVGPIPSYLFNASEFLKNKKISIDVVEQLLQIVQSEISPISDARGTAAYKALLLNQLIKGHFLKLFPELPAAQLVRLHA